MKYLQQGDVLLYREKIPKSATERVLDPILEHGEHTGHKHQLHYEMAFDRTGGGAPDVAWEIWKDPKSGERYLKIKSPTDLKHEEHNTISVPPGEYKLGRVLEYDHFAQEARAVQD